MSNIFLPPNIVQINCDSREHKLKAERLVWVQKVGYVRKVMNLTSWSQFHYLIISTFIFLFCHCHLEAGGTKDHQTDILSPLISAPPSVESSEVGRWRLRVYVGTCDRWYARSVERQVELPASPRQPPPPGPHILTWGRPTQSINTNLFLIPMLLSQLIVNYYSSWRSADSFPCQSSTVVVSAVNGWSLLIGLLNNSQLKPPQDNYSQTGTFHLLYVVSLFNIPNVLLQGNQLNFIKWILGKSPWYLSEIW